MSSPLRLVLLLALAPWMPSGAEVLRYHTLVVDGQNKIMPWFTPNANAFDNYLDKCWEWAVAAPNDSHGLPISFLHCAWRVGNPPTADPNWENDVGEKIPNWVESARLYYQYSGDRAPLDYVKRLVDYSLDHGQTPSDHLWANFPVGTSNAGDTEFRGFTGVWALWDCHVDLAADIGFSMYRMYQIYGDVKYRDKAIHVADVLVSKMVAGTANDSPWPYVINSQSGANQSRYAASWDGALQLFDLLIQNNQGSVSNYVSARSSLKSWLLSYPMQNGNWVDGHSDVKINGTTNWSTTCASDMCLYLLENPTWDPNFMTDVPKLLKWTEDNFVNSSSGDGLPGEYHGAYVPGEQTAYNMRMGYQAARLGAQYALWYEVSGDATYKDRAYRCLTYNTYMMQENGQSSDGPTDGVGWWWSDCYGEATRMYYYGMAAVPEWAPPNENHMLRSSSVVKSASYSSSGISYTTCAASSTEMFRIATGIQSVTANGSALALRTDLNAAGYTFNNGVLKIRHDAETNIVITYAAAPSPPTVGLVSSGNLIAPSNVTLTATASDSGGVVKVEFFEDSNKIGEDSTAPYECVWRNVPAGTFSLSAKATDTDGLTSTSTIGITVVAPSAATIIGNSSEGDKLDYITDASGAWINACRFIAPASQQLTVIKAKIGPVTSSYQCAIYSDDNNAAKALLRATNQITPTTDGWCTFTLTSPYEATAGSAYWLAIWSNDTAARIHSDSSGTVRFAAYPYGSWPNPVNLSGSGSGFNYCIYATGPGKTAFQQWKINNNIAETTNPNSDVDGDGLDLLTEYALGTDPFSRDALPTATRDGGYLALTYTKSKAATDVTTLAEVCGDLASWSNLAADIQQQWQITDGTTQQTITARDKSPISSNRSRFIRLRNTQQ